MVGEFNSFVTLRNQVEYERNTTGNVSKELVRRLKRKQAHFDAVLASHKRHLTRHGGHSKPKHESEVQLLILRAVNDLAATHASFNDAYRSVVGTIPDPIRFRLTSSSTDYHLWCRRINHQPWNSA